MKDPKLDIKDDKDAKRLAEDLDNMRRTAGWKRITEFLIKKIEYLEWQLANAEVTDLTEIYRIRDKRNITEQFVNLPEILIEFSKKAEGQDIDLDPYEKEEDQDISSYIKN